MLVSRHRIHTFLFLILLALFLGGCSVENDCNDLLQPASVAVQKESPSSYVNCLSTPVVWAEGHGLTGEDCAHLTGLRGVPGVESFVEPYDDTLIDGYPVYRNPSVNEWQAETIDGTTLGEIGVRLDWADNLTRQTWTDKSKVRVEIVLFEDLADPLTGYNMYSLGGTRLDEIFVTNSTTYDATIATVYSNVARLKIEKLTDEGGVPMLTVYESPCYDRYFVDGPTDAYSAEINMGGKCIYGFNWDVRDVPLAERAGWYRLTFSLDDQVDYVDYDGVEHNYARNTRIDELDPADELGYSDPEVVVYPPKLATDGLSSTLEIYIKPGGGKTGNSRGA